jgi:hypothetical protein
LTLIRDLPKSRACAEIFASNEAGCAEPRGSHHGRLADAKWATRRRGGRNSSIRSNVD